MHMVCDTLHAVCFAFQAALFFRHVTLEMASQGLMVVMRSACRHLYCSDDDSFDGRCGTAQRGLSGDLITVA